MNDRPQWRPNVALQEQLDKARAERDAFRAEADAMARVWEAQHAHLVAPTVHTLHEVNAAEIAAAPALARAAERRKAAG